MYNPIFFACDVSFQGSCGHGILNRWIDGCSFSFLGTKTSMRYIIACAVPSEISHSASSSSCRRRQRVCLKIDFWSPNTNSSGKVWPQKSGFLGKPWSLCAWQTPCGLYSNLDDKRIGCTSEILCSCFDSCISYAWSQSSHHMSPTAGGAEGAVTAYSGILPSTGFFLYRQDCWNGWKPSAMGALPRCEACNFFRKACTPDAKQDWWIVQRYDQHFGCRCCVPLEYLCGTRLSSKAYFHNLFLHVPMTWLS